MNLTTVPFMLISHFLTHTHAKPRKKVIKTENERDRERKGEERQKMSWSFLSLFNIKEDLLLLTTLCLSLSVLLAQRDESEEREMVRNETIKKETRKDLRCMYVMQFITSGVCLVAATSLLHNK